MSGIVWVNSFLFSTQPLISVVLSLKCPEGFKLPNPLLPPPTRDSLQTSLGRAVVRGLMFGGRGHRPGETSVGGLRGWLSLSAVGCLRPPPAQLVVTLITRPLSLCKGSSCSLGFHPAPSVPDCLGVCEAQLECHDASPAP